MSCLKLLVPVFRQIERRAFRAAQRINVVSEGFIPHIRAIAPDVPITCYTNGIDDIFLTETFQKPERRRDQPLILYAGNMGEGQGLHRIVPMVAKALNGEARFRLIGDGGKRRELESTLQAEGLSNVELLPPVSRDKLIAHYRDADILFLHLNDLDAFRKVLPSKIFEYAATGRPMLAGVAGLAADFLAKNLPDAEVFAPQDAPAMIQAVRRLAGTQPVIDRTAFRHEFSREAIMRKLTQDVMSLLKR